jgi:hypothetical protein
MGARTRSFRQISPKRNFASANTPPYTGRQNPNALTLADVRQWATKRLNPPAKLYGSTREQCQPALRGVMWRTFGATPTTMAPRRSAHMSRASRFSRA